MYADSTITEIVGRLLIVGFYLVMLVKNIMAWDIHVERTRALVPFPATLLTSGFVVQFVGSTLILLDYYAAVGAAALIVFTVMATFLYHRYWTVEDPRMRTYHVLLFSNNVAIIGGLFLIM